MKTRILISLLLFVGIITLAYVLSPAEARPFSNFRWNIDETYHRDGHVQFVVQKGSENFLPVGVKGLNNVTVTLHPTINHDQTGDAKLPRGVDIYFEPDVVTLSDGEIKTVKLVINVDENAPANLYDVQIVGTWKEENNTSGFMGSAIRLHVGHDFGDGKIPVNMLDPPLKFWKLIKNEEGITVNDVPCRNDYVLIVKYDGTPACVTSETKDRLIERGWTTKDSSVQKIIERLKQGSQPVDEVDANYIESLALMDPVVSNFVSETNWESHCCGYSTKNDIYELTITFLDIENQQQIGVTFDLSTLGIIDIDNGRTRIIGGPGT